MARALLLLAPLGLLTLGACSPDASEATPGDLELQGRGQCNGNPPMIVSNCFIPSGAMGDGEVEGRLVPNPSCLDIAREPGARGACHSFRWNVNDVLWAGLYFQHPDNNWGDRPGRAVNSEAFSEVTFLARASEDGVSANFAVGGIGDVNIPNLATGTVTAYEDSFNVELNNQTLTTVWQRFNIDISGQTFDSVIGAFAWYASVPGGTDFTTLDPITIYIDDLVWQ